MPGCPIVRIAKHKDSRSISGAMGHHLRTIPTKNADPERTPDNVVIVGPDSPRKVANLVKKRTDHLVRRKDANRAIELFLGASDDFWAVPGASWMELAEGYRTWLNGEFGEANVQSMGVHLDESKPHFWALITPITPAGKLASSHWFDGPSKLSKLQDRLAEHMAPLGMVRGRRGVKATHLEVSDWHQAQAGSKAAQKRIQAEMAKREADDLERAKKAEAQAEAAERRERDARARAAQAEIRATSVLEKAAAQVVELISRAKAEAVQILQEAKRRLDLILRREDAVRQEELRLQILAASLTPIEEERAARLLADIQAKKAEIPVPARPVPGSHLKEGSRGEVTGPGMA